MRTAIYKPSANIETGSAFQFSIGTKKNSSVPVMFIEAVKQSKPKPPPGSKESPFDWKSDKITMMLNVDELGQVASCIAGLDRRPMEFLHTSTFDGQSKTSIFKLSPPMTDSEKKYGNWNIQVSLKTGDGTRHVRGYLEPKFVYRLKVLADGIINKFNDLEEMRGGNYRSDDHPF